MRKAFSTPAYRPLVSSLLPFNHSPNHLRTVGVRKDCPVLRCRISERTLRTCVSVLAVFSACSQPRATSQALCLTTSLVLLMWSFPVESRHAACQNFERSRLCNEAIVLFAPPEG